MAESAQYGSDGSLDVVGFDPIAPRWRSTRQRTSRPSRDPAEQRLQVRNLLDDHLIRVQTPLSAPILVRKVHIHDDHTTPLLTTTETRNVVMS